MINAAMVLMILAGVFGLPAVMCSGFCSGMANLATADMDVPKTQQYIMSFLMYLAIFASIGSIVVGALIKKIKRITSVIAALFFAICFLLLMAQANMFGLPSAIMLLISGVMIFVAPAERFKDIQKIQTSN